MSVKEADMLMHYGMPRRSGRYPWGSGDDPYQHGSSDFLSRVEELKKKGWTETPENIKKEFGLTTTQYRMEKSIAVNDRKQLDIARAKSLADDGLGATEIARRMSTADKTINESTVRGWLKQEAENKKVKARDIADIIKKEIDTKGMIDVGKGVEVDLNISREKLNQALKLLNEEGYPTYKGGIPQVTNPGKQTTQMVICPPGTEHKEIYDFDKVNSLKEYISRDGGDTLEKKFNYPASMDSKRIKVLYGDEVGLDGYKGVDKDGVIEIRRGVQDLSLGNSHYSQVRILIDDKMFAKGMAVYSDNIPDGYDMVFNTNKKKGTPLLNDDPNGASVFKKIKSDPDNPFGSAIKDAEQGGQYWYTDKNGKRQLGLINKRADEGDWTEWKDKVPSQFLSKQPESLAKRQLNLAIDDSKNEFDSIKSITNPTIKKHFLNKFADECDSAAVHLQAAALPGQKYHVIIPVNSLKDNEIYAPRYANGTQLALIRYPHGGTFEIPIVKVNNKHQGAQKLLGKDIIDAVGINSKVAERLSGADFDGDTVMCIPTNTKQGIKISSRNQLEGLKNFDPKAEYPYRPGMKVMKNTQTEMGIISNLITDMTIKGANENELAAAVRHSMVVIDAEKHKLDYKKSYEVNGIAKLKKEYQEGGASTLISRAKNEQSVLKRQGTPKINIKGTKDYDPSKPEGSLLYKTADDVEYTYLKVNKRTGETTTVTKYRTQASTRMGETEDARTIISDANTPMERAYASYANTMKQMARDARVLAYNTGKVAYDPKAKKAYDDEVRSLDSKLNTAIVNAPKEREAQRRANLEVNAKKENYKLANNGEKMKAEDVKKASQQAITKYRDEVTATSRRKRNIDITDREWEAIQAGAISENKLQRILDNSDIDALRQRATPKATTNVSQAKINKIKQMQGDYTLEEIAKSCGLSVSTVTKYLKGGN